jgi:hypothetical protein
MKKFVLTLTAFLAVLFFVMTAKTEAGLGENGTGWPWGGSESPGDAVVNGNETGVGWISLNSTNIGGGSDYGINFPVGNGPVTGNVWSENLGYINFQPAGPYPAGPAFGVTRNGDNLEGWARFEEIRLAGANAGGWLGWIKMSGIAQNGAPYGVSINPVNGRLFGSGWSDELGWVDFSRGVIRGTPQFAVCPESLAVLVGTPRTLEARYWSNYIGAGTADCSSANWESDQTAAATWSTSNLIVATAASGTVTGVNPGSANITATYNGITKVVPVTVTSICNYKFCSESTSPAYSCQVQTVVNGTCPADNCSDTTTPETCAPIKSGSWKEVAP